MPEEKNEEDQLRELPSKPDKPPKPKKSKPAKSADFKEKLKKVGSGFVSFVKNIPSFFKNLFSVPKDPVKFRKKLILLIVFGILFLIIVAIVVFGV
ncbi:unnamed protein product, partial [marine sediment metagenome]